MKVTHFLLLQYFISHLQLYRYLINCSFYIFYIVLPQHCCRWGRSRYRYRTLRTRHFIALKNVEKYMVYLFFIYFTHFGIMWHAKFTVPVYSIITPDLPNNSSSFLKQVYCRIQFYACQ
jgi:hypothetical protein